MPVACVFGPRNTTEAVKTHPIRRVRFSFQGARAAAMRSGSTPGNSRSQRGPLEELLPVNWAQRPRKR